MAGTCWGPWSTNGNAKRTKGIGWNKKNKNNWPHKCWPTWRTKRSLGEAGVDEEGGEEKEEEEEAATTATVPWKTGKKCMPDVCGTEHTV